MRIAVVGLGYVGLVTATCLARLGQEVVGLEVDTAKLHVLEAGKVPYFEPHLDGELGAQRSAGRLSFTGDAANALAGADAILICVGTPSDETGHADLRAVLAVADSVATHADGNPVVVLRSTVPIGTTRRVEAQLNEGRKVRGLAPVPVIANPEFLRTGRAIEDFLRPTRVVIGTTDLASPEALALLATLYAPLEAPLVVTDAESAELVKNASNAFLAMKISFVNELAALCDASGADIDDVVAGMALDPRIGSQFMRPGIGYGGSCLPKDVRSLVAVGNDHGTLMRIATAIDDVNRGQVGRLVGTLEDVMERPVEGARIGVLGLAFKPDTDDTRESPALELADQLHARGVTVVACDPEAAAKAQASRPWLQIAADPLEVGRDADAVILATEWPAFVTMDLDILASSMRGRVLVDGRNALDPAKAAAAGLRYVGVGRRADA